MFFSSPGIDHRSILQAFRVQVQKNLLKHQMVFVQKKKSLKRWLFLHFINFKLVLVLVKNDLSETVLTQLILLSSVPSACCWRHVPMIHPYSSKARSVSFFFLKFDTLKNCFHWLKTRLLIVRFCFFNNLIKYQSMKLADVSWRISASPDQAVLLVPSRKGWDPQ